MRRWIEAVAVAAVLAGCSKGDGEGGGPTDADASGTPDGTPETEVVFETFVHPTMEATVAGRADYACFTPGADHA
nr:hypothetical protein [Deltaproteobacteria bacterium]